MLSEKNNQNMTMAWYQRVAPICKAQGLDIAEIFGNIHIYSAVGEWYFQPKAGKIRLFYRDTSYANCNGFTAMVFKVLSPFDLVAYIWRHDAVKSRNLCAAAV